MLGIIDHCEIHITSYNHWVFSLWENLDQKLEKKSSSSQPGWCAWSLARTDGRPVVADWPTGCLRDALLDHGSSRWRTLGWWRTFWSRPDQVQDIICKLWFDSALLLYMCLKHVITGSPSNFKIKPTINLRSWSAFTGFSCKDPTKVQANLSCSSSPLSQLFL